MIWLSTVSLVAGGLLAQRFKIIVLVPATFVVVVIALAVGMAQTGGVWSIILMIATTSVGLQIGYFLGMFIKIWPGCAAGTLNHLAWRPGRRTAWGGSDRSKGPEEAQSSFSNCSRVD
jgi:hypothetical protein